MVRQLRVHDDVDARFLGGHGIRPELIAFDSRVENRQQLSHIAATRANFFGLPAASRRR